MAYTDDWENLMNGVFGREENCALIRRKRRRKSPVCPI